MNDAIVFQNVKKAYNGTFRAAVNDVSLEVMEGHLVVLLGPSGCGKTTLLKMVNRLIEPTSGKIFINGTEIHALKITELRRRIGYVIQQVGLFPHMRIDENVKVVPKMLGWNKEKMATRTDELLDLVGLPPAEFKRRYPAQLSGGQQQRVGLARALAADPPLMLMDEPFAAIDNITRTRLQDELLRIQHTVRKTILFVTHDVEEAIKLADEIVVMRDGNVLQYDTPLNILSNPADEFVARLTGAEDVLRRLSLQPVASVMERLKGNFDTSSGKKVAATSNLRDALNLLLTNPGEQLIVINDENYPVGSLSIESIHQFTQVTQPKQPSELAKDGH